MTEPEPEPRYRSSAVPLTLPIANAIEQVATSNRQPVRLLHEVPAAEREWGWDRWAWAWVGPVDSQPLAGVERPVVAYSGHCLTRLDCRFNLARHDSAHRRMVAGRKPRPGWLPMPWEIALIAVLAAVALYFGLVFVA